MEGSPVRAGLESRLLRGEGSRRGGLEDDWIGPIDPARWAQALKEENLIQSSSGIRAVVAPELKGLRFPLQEPLAEAELSNEHKLLYARYGYLYAKQQILKFPRRFSPPMTFVVANDGRPTGRAMLEAQMRGMKAAAAEEPGTKLRFRMSRGVPGEVPPGVLPTPFAQGLVRMAIRGKWGRGGAIVTASHNPLLWNGVKYLTGHRQLPGSPVDGGVVLPGAQMDSVIREEFRPWAKGVREGTISPEDFRAQVNAARLQRSKDFKTVPPSRIVRQMTREAERMWGLNGQALRDFRKKAKAIKILLDPNGGAAIWYYERFLEHFGFQVEEISGSDRSGQPQHLIEPISDAKESGDPNTDALNHARRALEERQAHFAVVFDMDADRGNLVFRDPASGRIVSPNPNEVAGFNLAMGLSRASLARADREKGSVVVVHSMPDGRLREIAGTFGARVEQVDVGEVNVVQRMRELERAGHRVILGLEQANGGTIFRGDDPRVLGDTSRNGALGALFTGMVLSTPQIGRHWLERRKAFLLSHPTAAVPAVPVPEAPGLLELFESLPGERSRGSWKFVTRLAKPTVTPKGRNEVPEAALPAFKLAIEQNWYKRDWARLHNEGLRLAEDSYLKIRDFRIGYFEGPQEPVFFGPADFPPTIERIRPYPRGGWVLRLFAEDGTTQTIALRGSLTEGMMRLSTEGQGERAVEIAQALEDLAAREWYPAARRQALAARPKAGLEGRKGEREGEEEGVLYRLSGRTFDEVLKLIAEMDPVAYRFGDSGEVWREGSIRPGSYGSLPDKDAAFMAAAVERFGSEEDARVAEYDVIALSRDGSGDPDQRLILQITPSRRQEVREESVLERARRLGHEPKEFPDVRDFPKHWEMEWREEDLTHGQLVAAISDYRPLSYRLHYYPDPASEKEERESVYRSSLPMDPDKVWLVTLGQSLTDVVNRVILRYFRTDLTLETIRYDLTAFPAGKEEFWRQEYHFEIRVINPFPQVQAGLENLDRFLGVSDVDSRAFAEDAGAEALGSQL